MSEQKPTKTDGSQQAQGLGFSKLSMNEIAPAVTADPATTNNRSGRMWLVAVAILIVVVGGGVMLRSASNFPPNTTEQERFRDQVSALPFGQDGTIQRVDFSTGTSLQIDFSSIISTEDADQRATLRQATTAVLKLFAQLKPGKDLTVTGYQGETKIVEARYSPTSAFVNKDKPGEIDAVLWVQNGEQDSIGSSRGDARRGAGVSGQQ